MTRDSNPFNATPSASQRGVSLVEALVALAVMAFGLLGVVGMQATLRANSDITKQRADAVRLSQVQVEDWRAFERLTPGAGAAFSQIGDIVPTGPLPASPGANARFTRSATVAPGPTVPASAPKLKTVAVTVAWKDRTDSDHTVRLVSAIAGISPEVAGSLSLPTDRSVSQRPGGRHGGVPMGAVDQRTAPGGDGTNTSRFTVPGSAGNTVWVFNNVTGVITSICTALAPCVAGDRFLLSGFVRFATGTVPSSAESENPTDPPPTALVQGTPAVPGTPGTPATPALELEVRLSQPASLVETCFIQTLPGVSALGYYCAVPITVNNTWSGQSVFVSPLISTTLADDDASHYKVCRYTPTATHTPTGGNTANPLTYSNVTGGLTNQNFLFISAGDRVAPASGGTVFSCPTDNTATPLINGNTYPHQPTA